MTSSFQHRLLLLSLLAALELWPAGRSAAQTLNALHQFSQTRTNELGTDTNRDGAFPEAGVVVSGRTVYGTTVYGGPGGWGTVYSVNIDGTSFTNLHYFSFDTYAAYTNSDGGFLQGGLLLSGNTLYGTTDVGGSYGGGTLFSLNLDGTGFTNLYNFAYTNGSSPAELILSGNTLYGTTVEGGSSGFGTVFKISTSGDGFTNIYNFTATSGQLPTNADGSYPQGSLILSGKTLFGTTEYGGNFGYGTVFRVNTDGTSFTNLHDFAPLSGIYNTNADGADLYAGLVLFGSTLYGTTYEGGIWGDGTLFALQTDGLGFTNLHNFSGYPDDGTDPDGQLILAGNTLYGTASAGGSSGAGTVFAINTNGTGYTSVYSFSRPDYSDAIGIVTNNDGYSPYAGLILLSNTLYGTAFEGGNGGAGTVFSLSFPPKLEIKLSDTNVILSWPTNFEGFNYVGYNLQTASNIEASAVWTTVAPAPVLVLGQNTVTNALKRPQKFYRLSR